jgi:hypothetical protein
MVPLGSLFCENEPVPGFYGRSRNLNAVEMNLPKTILVKYKTRPLFLHRFNVILSDGCHEINYKNLLIQKTALIN